MGVERKTKSGPQRRLVAEGLFEDVAGEPALVGSACDDCSAVTFPAQVSCTKCTGQNVQLRPLARTGTIWGFTVQRFPPKPPYPGADGPFVRTGSAMSTSGATSWWSPASWPTTSSRYTSAADETGPRTVPPHAGRRYVPHLRVHARRGLEGQRREQRWSFMTEVAIVGIGIHPFGRTEGVSGRDAGGGPPRARAGGRRHRVDRRAVRVRGQRRRRQRRHPGRRPRAHRASSSST